MGIGDIFRELIESGTHDRTQPALPTADTPAFRNCHRSCPYLSIKYLDPLLERREDGEDSDLLVGAGDCTGRQRVAETKQCELSSSEVLKCSNMPQAGQDERQGSN